jgi:biopolymer transport protein ExbD
MARARKPQENPALDMTPMIDVVFELIIFFVVTLTEAQKKDETIELEDGRHGIVLTPEELPPSHMQVDIGVVQSGPKRGKPRISMGNVELTPGEIGKRIRDRYKKYGEFPVIIRADYAVPHAAVAQVMEACTQNNIWRISFMAVQEDKTSKPGKPGRKRLSALKRRTN